MSFACNIKNSKKNVDPKELSNILFLRTVGLDNVNTVETDINICPEVFKNPTFYVDGATKLASGITSTFTGCTTGTTGTTFVYNLDYNPDFDITFVITGNTDYTGYTGSFCYRIYSDDRFVASFPATGLIRGSETLESCTPFSAITSGTVIQHIVEGQLPNDWVQYLIRPYFTFVTKSCSPGYEFNSLDYTIPLNLFNQDTDYYFMTVKNPPIPRLNPPNSEIVPDYRFYQQVVLANGQSGPRGPQSLPGELNYWYLDRVPTDSRTVMCFLNGVLLTIGSDYEILSINGFGNPPVLKINGTVKYTDWIVLYYPLGILPSTVLPTWTIDTFQVNSSNMTVDIGNPGLGTNYLNYNTITGKQELYTLKNIDGNAGVPIVFVNGVELITFQQVFPSTTQPNRLILNNILIHEGDIISIFYNSIKIIGKDYGSLEKPEFTIGWYVDEINNPNITGQFIVKVYDNDVIGGPVLYQQIVNYNPEQYDYTATISSLALNISYRFEVWFEVVYNAYLNNGVKTCSMDYGYFNTQSNYINNTY